MTQDEAARNSGRDSGGAGAGDERPRPRYGEYAPEGWTWQPPADPHAAPSPASTDAVPTSLPAARRPDAAASAAARPVRPADRLATVLLLVIGLLGALSAVGTLQALPEQLPLAIRQASEMLGTNMADFEYTPLPSVPGTLLVGSIAQILLWVLTAWWSIARLRARRLAFWVPLAAGAVSFVLLYATMFVVILNDPALVEAVTPA